jgi:hypothetical protein
MVILNNGLEKQTISTERFKESIQDFNFGTDILTKNKINIKNGISIEGKSALILELAK